MSKIAKFVGLDVHKATIAIAVCGGGPLGEARSLGTIPHDLTRLVHRLEHLGPPEDVHIAYEAGPHWLRSVPRPARARPPLHRRGTVQDPGAHG